jgi:pimeloyl-ACP methyl ester carboxylesterase
MKAKLCIVMGLGMVLAADGRAGPVEGYQAKVAVSAPTRIDWTFVLATQSLTEPLANWKMNDYDSTAQQYEVYVPPRPDPKKPLPVLLYVSPIKVGGWPAFAALCQQRGILFASPLNAGNDCTPPRRVRIVLDVLDDLRRNYAIDPDRTYITGLSGGGYMASAIAFALPEHFGGVMPICGCSDWRQESWLRQRVVERLSVAILTGEKDFNRPEGERLRGPYFKEVGVRARVWVQSGLGHAIPKPAILAEAVRWMDEGAKARAEAARRWPAQRIAGNAAPDREELAKALLAEGKKRLEKPETLFSGLMQLQGCMKRWPDLAAAAEAKKILLEYEGKTEKPWEADDLAEQRRFLVAKARALDAYVSADLPAIYAKERPGLARMAIDLWQKVAADGPDTPAGQEAKKRIPILEKIAGKTDQ